MPKKEYHEGIIRDDQDPKKRGRLNIECPSIASNETLDWVEPIFHFVDSENQAGSFFVPSVGSTVTVEIESEENSETTDLRARWRCDVYPEGSVPEEFQENYPKRRGWKTPEGHIFYFDDTEDSQTFYYKHPSGTEIVINNDGQIELKPTGNQSVLIGEGADESLVLGNELVSFLDSMKTIYNTHTHSSPAGGNTGIPNGDSFPDADDTLLSDNHKVK